MVSWPGRAGLQVPALVLDDVVRRRFASQDPSLLGTSRVAGESFVHAHATVLAWFDEIPSAAQVARLASCDAVTARITTVEAFPNGVIHAPLVVDGGWYHLTTAARTLFPDVIAYDGSFDVVPHVTLDATTSGATVDGLRGEVRPLLPLTVRVNQLDVVWYEQHATHLAQRIQLTDPAHGP